MGPFTEGDLAERAAFLLRGIAEEHPFVDGNKRTAFEAADTYLRSNGVRIDATPDETVAFMLAVARGELHLSAMTDWIRFRIRKV